MVTGRIWLGRYATLSTAPKKGQRPSTAALQLYQPTGNLPRDILVKSRLLCLSFDFWVSWSSPMWLLIFRFPWHFRLRGAVWVAKAKRYTFLQLVFKALPSVERPNFTRAKSAPGWHSKPHSSLIVATYCRAAFTCQFPFAVVVHPRSPLPAPVANASFELPVASCHLPVLVRHISAPIAASSASQVFTVYTHFRSNLHFNLLSPFPYWATLLYTSLTAGCAAIRLAADFKL